MLDVDYNTIIDSDIVLLGNTTVDVASGMNLQYRGDAIDLLNYQLTFLGNGEYLFEYVRHSAKQSWKFADSCRRHNYLAH